MTDRESYNTVMNLLLCVINKAKEPNKIYYPWKFLGALMYHTTSISDPRLPLVGLYHRMSETHQMLHMTQIPKYVIQLENEHIFWNSCDDRKSVRDIVELIALKIGKKTFKHLIEQFISDVSLVHFSLTVSGDEAIENLKWFLKNVHDLL